MYKVVKNTDSDHALVVGEPEHTFATCTSYVVHGDKAVIVKELTKICATLTHGEAGYILNLIIYEVTVGSLVQVTVPEVMVILETCTFAGTVSQR